MSEYVYLAATIALGIGALVLVYVVQSRGTKGLNERRPWHHYLLLWPIVLDADQKKRGDRFLTTREWIGWAVVGLIIVLAVTFT